MTLSDARRAYREFMSRPETAFAFGSGCAMDGGHPALRAIRDEADRLLAQVRTLEVASGLPLNPPGRRVSWSVSPN
jgi:hypothetical protein